MSEQEKFHQDDDSKLDEMLDAMLSAYSAAGPRPGLETRILAQVRAQDRKQNRGWNFRWVWAAAAVTSAAVILMVIYMSRPQSRPGAQQVVTAIQQPGTQKPNTQIKGNPEPVQRKKAMSLTASNIPSVGGKKTRGARTQQPAVTEVAAVRKDVFPSRSPLSEQEKLLLRYLSRTPREELIAQSRPDPPSDDTDEDAKEPRLQNLIRVPQRNSYTR